MMFNVIEFLQVIFVLLLSVVCHEFSHGWVADKFGDPTARLSGRLTLNPLKHIDLVGMIVVPFVLRLLGFMPLGWAKPVPVNFFNLRNPRRDMILVAASGPVTNFSLAVICSQVLRITPWPFVHETLQQAVVLNLVLAVFNLIPIPPLDGSRVVAGLLPPDLGRMYSYLEPFGFIIVIVMLNLGFLNFVEKIVKFLAVVLLQTTVLP